MIAGRVHAIAATIAFWVFVSIMGLGAYYMLSDFGATASAIDSTLRRTIQFGYIDHATGQYQQAVQNVERTPDKVCWSLYMQKMWEGEIISWDFYADGGTTSAPIPTAAYVVDNDDRPDAYPMRAHSVGSQWVRRWCFAIAGRIPPFKPIIITGKARHSLWPHLWVSVEETPTFTVPWITPL